MWRHRTRRRSMALALAVAIPVMTTGTAALAGSTDTTYDPVRDFGSLANVARAVGADRAWAKGFTGEGIDIAVIDTGISPVVGLDGPGHVIDGPDVSFDSPNPVLAHLDGVGHGTHIGGIIAGKEGDAPVSAADPDRFLGIAPDARLINIKAGDNTGAVDVSQVIAALDWIVQYGDRDGLDIRVVNLSFGTEGIQPYLIDPLARAVENAWNDGIVVVVAAGNDGKGLVGLANPANDPFVIAVGAAEQTASGWTIPSFATSGNVLRNPDVIAPGRSIASLRVPGSRADTEYPSARVGDDLFRGSGSSQSAAVVSGVVALLLEQRPSLTPNQVKSILRSTANPVRGISVTQQGQGLVDIADALSARAPWLSLQLHLPSTGLGLLHLSRGLDRVAIDGRVIQGEITVWGEAFVPRVWLASSGSSAWKGGSWSGGSWSGGSWSGGSWSGGSWSGGSWSGGSWSGGSWSGGSWSGGSWSGGSWSGAGWS